MADQNQSAKNGAPEGDSDEDQAVDLTQADLDAARADAADARPNAEAVVAELNDRILRLAAELENTRRRAARDKTDAGRYAIARPLRAICWKSSIISNARSARPDEKTGRQTAKPFLASLPGFK